MAATRFDAFAVPLRLDLAPEEVWRAVADPATRHPEDDLAHLRGAIRLRLNGLATAFAR